jgi:hypothetical protein
VLSEDTDVVFPTPVANETPNRVRGEGTYPFQCSHSQREQQRNNRDNHSKRSKRLDAGSKRRKRCIAAGQLGGIRYIHASRALFILESFNMVVPQSEKAVRSLTTQRFGAALGAVPPQQSKQVLVI